MSLLFGRKLAIKVFCTQSEYQQYIALTFFVNNVINQLYKKHKCDSSKNEMTCWFGGLNLDVDNDLMICNFIILEPISVTFDAFDSIMPGQQNSMY